MTSIDCTLLGDGSSDSMLKYPIEWLMREVFPAMAVNVTFADLRNLSVEEGSLNQRIISAIEYYPCDILFIHRDAEGEPFTVREKEIHKAIESLIERAEIMVPVIPVRMTEAWFLHDAEAIKTAAGNPHSKVDLQLPAIGKVHELIDPKKKLEQALSNSASLSKRRMKNFRPRKRMHRLSELIEDFSPLREQDSFLALEQLLRDLSVYFPARP